MRKTFGEFFLKCNLLTFIKLRCNNRFCFHQMINRAKDYDVGYLIVENDEIQHKKGKLIFF